MYGIKNKITPGTRKTNEDISGLPINLLAIPMIEISCGVSSDAFRVFLVIID